MKQITDVRDLTHPYGLLVDFGLEDAPRPTNMVFPFVLGIVVSISGSEQGFRGKKEIQRTIRTSLHRNKRPKSCVPFPALRSINQISQRTPSLKKKRGGGANIIQAH